MKVREWLGPKSTSQLQTYYKFIERHFQQKNIQITYDQALRLYKTLLQIIRSPFVDIMQINCSQQQQNQLRPPQIKSKKSTNKIPLSSYTKDQEIQLVQFYLKYKKTQIISEKMNKKWGFNIKWSHKSIEHILKSIIKKTLHKIKRSRQKFLKNSVQLKCKQSQEQINCFYQQNDENSIKQRLFRFYINNKISLSSLSNIILQINKYLSNNSLSELEVTLQDNIDIKYEKQLENQISRRNLHEISRKSKQIKIQKSKQTNQNDNVQDLELFINTKYQKSSQETRQEIKEQQNIQHSFKQLLYQQVIQIQ